MLGALFIGSSESKRIGHRNPSICVYDMMNATHSDQDLPASYPAGTYLAFPKSVKLNLTVNRLNEYAKCLADIFVNSLICLGYGHLLFCVKAYVCMQRLSLVCTQKLTPCESDSFFGNS